jgi:hypothetical protein
VHALGPPLPVDEGAGVGAPVAVGVGGLGGSVDGDDGDVVEPVLGVPFVPVVEPR